MNYIHSTSLAAAAGFVYGFSYHPKIFMNEPIGTILVGTVSGTLYGAASEFLHGMVPSQFKPIVPLIIVAATVRQFV